MNRKHFSDLSIIIGPAIVILVLGMILGTGIAIFIPFDDSTLNWAFVGTLVAVILLVISITIARQRVIHDLRRAEQSYRTLIEQSLQGILVMHQGRVIFANPAITQIIGYTSDELQALSPVEVLNLIHPDDRAQIAQAIKERMAGIPFTHPQDSRFFHKDGSVIWAITNGVLIEYQGQPALQVVVQDISARKQTEAALQESEARFRAIVENSNESIQFADANGIILYRSPYTRQINGFSDEERIGHNGFEIIHPDDREILRQRWTEVLNTPGQIHQAIYRIRHRDGSWRWVEARTRNLLDNPHIRAIVVTSHEITERVQAEEKLREREQIYRQAIEIAGEVPYLYIRTDETGNNSRFDFVGEGIRALTGYGPDEMSEQLWLSLIEEQVLLGDLASLSLDEAIQRVRIDPDIVWKCEYLIRARDGSLHWIYGTSVELRNQQGIAYGALGILQDITERKRAEEARQKLEAQLLQAQKMEAIGQLAGGIAHDFNNLLVPIIGYTDLVLMSLPSDDERHEDLRHVRESADRATVLTRQILAFSRKQALQMRVTDLNELVKQFQRMVHRLFGEQIELQTILAPTLAMVQADSAQIEQALLNLALNARDAMPHGGTLTIETGNRYLDTNDIARHAETQAAGTYAMLSVRDTGQGIDADALPHIFEPFFTTKERGKGTGLGLATVYGIIRQHGGMIWVSSTPGQGTSFMIYLPQIEHAVQFESPARIEAVISSRTATILVVEDEEMVRKLVCDTLMAHGYTVIEAANPEDGLRHAQTYQDTIDLLLTDVIMPHMDGHELYQQIAIIRQDINILYMSGYAPEIVGLRGILDEGIHFLQKPFTVHQLLQKIGTILTQITPD